MKDLGVIILALLIGAGIGWFARPVPAPVQLTKYVEKEIVKTVPEVRTRIETQYRDRYIEVEQTASGAASNGVVCAISGVCNSVSVSAGSSVSVSEGEGEEADLR